MDLCDIAVRLARDIGSGRILHPIIRSFAWRRLGHHPNQRLDEECM